MIEYITKPIVAMFNVEMNLWNVSPTSFLLLNGVGLFFSIEAFFFDYKHIKKFFEFTEKIDSQNRRKEKLK